MGRSLFCISLFHRTPALFIQYNTISVYFRDMLFYRKHSVAWCFLNNQPAWACLVTCIHSILDFVVVKSKLNLHLYITGSFYTELCVFIQDILSCFIHYTGLDKSTGPRSGTCLLLHRTRENISTVVRRTLTQAWFKPTFN